MSVIISELFCTILPGIVSFGIAFDAFMFFISFLISWREIYWKRKGCPQAVMPAGAIAPLEVVPAGRGAGWAWCPKAVVHAGGDAPLAVVPRPQWCSTHRGTPLAVVPCSR